VVAVGQEPLSGRARQMASVVLAGNMAPVSRQSLRIRQEGVTTVRAEFVIQLFPMTRP
jgi:hypothetical protein